MNFKKWGEIQTGLKQYGTEKYQQAKSFLTLPGEVYRGKQVSQKEVLEFALGIMGTGVPGGGRGISTVGSTVLPTKKIPKISYKTWLEQAQKSKANFPLQRVHYQGIQERAISLPGGRIGTKPGYRTFTDLKTKSTFLLPIEKATAKDIVNKLDELDILFKDEI